MQFSLPNRLFKFLGVAPLALIALSSALVTTVWAHSVGQVQTTKFFAPETIALLQSRISGGQPAGFVPGDILSYIIQFSPISNGATTGVAGYITDYLPPGVEVVGADVVNKDASGNFYSVAPQLPGGIDQGWGNRGAQSFAAPFNVNTYDSSGRCASAGLTNNCNGRLAEVYADTGIFYSTDPLTAAFPQLPIRIAQGTNGYNIQPTADGQLNPIIGQAVATTHNLWDANQTNAFGSGNVTPPAPRSSAPAINGGSGTAPYRAGSAVAGPDTGYPLDNTGQVGPWRRIAYVGSRIGDATTGPALLQQSSISYVAGNVTSLGSPLSTSNPLPSGTNAVRWAVGKLVVGQISYVRIQLRLLQPIPSGGLVNSSEVFGGDAGDADDGKDMTWRYHVPSVADNNSNLYVNKIPCQYDASATACTPLSGTYTAASTTITYQITYINTGNANQTNVVLQDLLPCQAASGTAVRVGAVTGPLAALITVPFTTSTTSNGTCGSPPTRATVTFPTISTLVAGSGGAMIININAKASTVDDAVTNVGKLSSTQLPGGVTSNATTFVGSNATPALSVVKTAVAPTATAGGSVQYVMVVQNIGTGAATNVQFDDILPSINDAAANVTTRFNYGSLQSVVSSGLTTATALVTSTTTAALGTLTPYNTQTGAANRVKVNFAFGATSSLVAGGRITLTFNVNVGSGVTASATPYYNDAVAQGLSGNTTRTDSGSSAPVTIASALSVTKTLLCYFSGGSCLSVGSGAAIPANSQVRYQINYANSSAGAVNTVSLSDLLPCQLSASPGTPVVTLTSASGSITPTANPWSVANGNCPATRQPLILGNAATLAAGATGSFVIDMLLSNPAGTSTAVVNDVSLSGSGVSTATAQAQNNVVTQAVLNITKSASQSAVFPGTTLSYTITVTNAGTTAAQTITVYDILPTGTSTTANTALRFNYVAGSSVIAGALASVSPTTQTPPTISPYNSGPYAANQVQISWVFTGQTLAPGATVTLVFTSQAGSSLPVLVAPNYYGNNAVGTYATAQQAASNTSQVNVSPVVNLSLLKSNSTTTVTAGGTTSYIITVGNAGPSAADGAVIRDIPGAGLSCQRVTCTSASGGATCPAALPLGTPVAAGSTTLFGAGEAIPSLPGGGAVALKVDCLVTATGQ